MIRLSLELPTLYLERFSPLLDLDFVLAHKVLQDERYAEFYRQRHADRELILDNSTHEFGAPLPFKKLIYAAKILSVTGKRVNHLIAPDIILNGQVTPYSQIEQNFHWLRETIAVVSTHEDTIAGTGAVICGGSDQHRQYFNLVNDGNVSLLCYTFHHPNRLDDWQWAVKQGWRYHASRVHLLGMSTLEELKRWVEESNRQEHVDFSFDTSKPLKFGVQRKLLRDVTDLRGGPVRSKEVLELTELDVEQEQMCEENILFLRSVCRGIW